MSSLWVFWAAEVLERLSEQGQEEQEVHLQVSGWGILVPFQWIEEDLSSSSPRKGFVPAAVYIAV